MAQFNINSLIPKLLENPKVQAIVEKLNELSVDLKAKEEELKGRLVQEKDQTVKQAMTKYKEVVKAMHELEKSVQAYKKQALAEKARLEKAFFGKTARKKTSKKAASKAKTAVKTTVKKAKKATSKKVASKKATSK